MPSPFFCSPVIRVVKENPHRKFKKKDVNIEFCQFYKAHKTSFNNWEIIWESYEFEYEWEFARKMSLLGSFFNKGTEQRAVLILKKHSNTSVHLVICLIFSQKLLHRAAMNAYLSLWHVCFVFHGKDS